MKIISLVFISERLSITAASLSWSKRESHLSLPHQVQNWRRKDGGRFAAVMDSLSEMNTKLMIFISPTL